MSRSWWEPQSGHVHCLSERKIVVSKSTIGTRFCRGSPLPNLYELTRMFDTLILEQLNKPVLCHVWTWEWVRSRAILRRTCPNAKCIIARPQVNNGRPWMVSLLRTGFTLNLKVDKAFVFYASLLYKREFDISVSLETRHILTQAALDCWVSLCLFLWMCHWKGGFSW